MLTYLDRTRRLEFPAGISMCHFDNLGKTGSIMSNRLALQVIDCWFQYGMGCFGQLHMKFPKLMAFLYHLVKHLEKDTNSVRLTLLFWIEEDVNDCQSNRNLPHLSGATVMRLNIADESVIPRKDAVPLISVPRSDQFNCTESDMCLEQDSWLRSASLLRTR